MKLRLLSLPLLLAGNLFGNAVFNGSFELGTTGFALEKDLRIDTNPALQFHPLAIVDGALKLDNSCAENYNIFSKEFLLPPDTEYRFTAKVRSQKPGEKIYFGIFKVDPQWTARSTTIQTGKDWTTVNITFRTEKKPGYYHVLIRPGEKDKSSSNTLFFDDLKLETTAPSSAQNIECAAVPEKTLFTLDREKTAKFIFKAHNPGKTPYDGIVSISGMDEYSKAPRFHREIKLQLAPGETKEIPFTEKITRFGGVRVKISGKDINSHDGFYSVIGQYTAKPIDVNKNFAVAFNDGLSYLLPPQTQYPSYRVNNADFGKNVELLSQAGCRILRDHDAGVRGVDWPAVEWEKGKFDFSHLDRQLSVYEKNHVLLFPVIGCGFIENYMPWQNQRWPRWAVPLCERVKNDPPNCMKTVCGHILLPPEKLYADYIRKTVEHIKGKVPVYEITNEPNLYLAPETYVRYLKLAHDAIRSVDPKAKISGFCISSDFGTAGAPWTEAAIKEGGLNYVDSIGFHPYGAPELGSINPADSNIDDLKKQISKHKDLPLWNTELYYLIDQKMPHEEYFCQPHHVAWRFLVDLGEGVVQSISIPGTYLWKRMLTPNMLTGAAYHELIPSENFVVYNALARFFEGAKTEKKFRYPNGVIGYVFRKDGKLIAAVWNYQKGKGIYADFSKFEVYDVFGNREKSGETLLSNAPFYLKPGNLSDAEFLAGIQNLALRLDRPVAVTPVARRVGNTLYVTMHNASATSQSGIVGISGEVAAVTPVRFALAPNESKAIAIALHPGKTAKKATLLLFHAGRSFPVALEIEENQLVGKEFSLKNATGNLRFGPNGIELSMKVKDATAPGALGKRQIWESDCVELFFDLNPLLSPKLHPNAYNADVFRLFIQPRDGMKLTALGSAVKGSDCKISGQNTPDGYSFTLTIPVKCGAALGFDVKIDDSDGKKILENSLSGKRELFKNRIHFNIAQ